MFITTKVVLDIHTGKILEQEGYEYFGPVAACKGGDSAVGSSIYNTGQLQNTLQQAFKAQYGASSDTLNFLTNKLMGNINNPTGFTPQTMAALNSNAINTTASQYQNAAKTAQAQEAANGGNGGYASGVNAQIGAQLAGQAANQTSNLLNQNQIQNGILQNQNYYAALGDLTTVNAQRNPLNYATNAIEAGNSIANQDNTYLNSRAYNSSVGPSGYLGGALSGALQGGLGSLGI